MEAIFEDDGGHWVWAVDDNSRAQRQAIKPGRFEGDLIEITEGLEVGEQIIAAGVSFIREGMQVKAISKERGL